MKVATLGPEGTFSHQAVLKYLGDTEIIFTKTIRDVFEEVEGGNAKNGIVPVENSVGGSVNFTLDSLLDFNLFIEAEEIMPVSHCLAGDKSFKKDQIKKLYLHEQTYSQCEEYIRKNFPNAKIHETASNSESAILAKRDNLVSACMAPEVCANIYDLKLIEKNVQDSRFNVTRFFIISKVKTQPSGFDKTSITVYPHADRPGLLWEILGVFNKKKINLTKIESRPTKGKLGDYIFYLDFEGHQNDKNVRGALVELEKTSFVKLLGSYPRRY